MAISKEELELREQRCKEMSSLLYQHRISLKLLSKYTKIGQNNLSAYRIGDWPITEKTFEKIKKGIEQIVELGINDRGYREGKARKHTKEDLELYAQRREHLRELIGTNHLSAQLIANHSGLSKVIILNYASGKNNMMEDSYNLLVETIQKMVRIGVYSESKKREHKRKIKNDPKDKLVEDWMIVHLGYHRNTIVIKNDIRGHEDKFIQELKEAGFDCHLRDTGSDHYVVEGTKIEHDHKNRS